jgi:hypothetical protein
MTAFLNWLRWLLRPWGWGGRRKAPQYPVYQRYPQLRVSSSGHQKPTHHSRGLKAKRKASRIHYQGQGRRGPNA